MQLEVEIYIYILSGNAQASFTPQGTSENFHKKSTGECTGDKVQAARFSQSLAWIKDRGFC